MVTNAHQATIAHEAQRPRRSRSAQLVPIDLNLRVRALRIAPRVLPEVPKTRRAKQFVSYVVVAQRLQMILQVATVLELSVLGNQAQTNVSAKLGIRMLLLLKNSRLRPKT